MDCTSVRSYFSFGIKGFERGMLFSIGPISYVMERLGMQRLH